MNNFISPARSIAERRYNTARYSIFLVALCSLLNVFFLVTQSGTYFLFSATIPYFVVDMGMFFTGMYPPDAYVDTGMTQFLDKSVLWFAVSVAILIIAFYVLCWLLSSKGRKNWLITALVCFSIDTLVMLYLYGVQMAMLLDLVFHVWVIVDLAIGLNAALKLEKIAAEEKNQPAAEVQEEFEREDSVPLRDADMGVKARVLLKTSALGREVIYRRVKRVNELVIDGKVYADIEMLAEPAHSLCARIDGHDIVVGFDGISKSFATLDGQMIASK